MGEKGNQLFENLRDNQIFRLRGAKKEKYHVHE